MGMTDMTIDALIDRLQQIRTHAGGDKYVRLVVDDRGVNLTDVLEGGPGKYRCTIYGESDYTRDIVVYNLGGRLA